MSGIKRFFSVDKSRTSPRKAAEGAKTSPSTKQEVIEFVDSDSDVEMLDMQPSSSKAAKAAPTASPKKEAPKKASPKKAPPPKKAAPKVEAEQPKAPAKAASAQNSLSASEILASLPSPDLPEVESGAKPNFRQLMQAKSNPDTSSGIEIEAAPNCLTGLTFVVTGQLPTLGREEIHSTIKRYGGNVTGSLSGRTSCMVLGEEAGPAKIAKAKQLGLKVLDEDGFLELLRRLPAEGGDSPAAEAARQKRRREEERIEQEVKRMRTEAASSSSGAGSSSVSQTQRPSSKTGSNAVDSSAGNEMWTTKYAPKSMADIVGNSGAVARLTGWLRNWDASRRGGRGDGSEFRAAMLSGPPGIGKTTAAHLVGELAGYEVVEYNASDTRSKTLLQQHVAQTLNNRSLSVGGSQLEGGTRKLLVIMDEVDGMSGGDRGGVGAMAAMARSSNVPLVLICNERTLPKMKPFDRSVFDINFRRPDASQVRSRLMAIARTESLNLDAAAVDQLTQATRGDIRQMLNLLETYRTTQKDMSYDGSREFSRTWNKEIVLKPFDIAARLLSRASQTTMTTNERLELYFHDYDFAPLMVQENYLTSSPSLAATAAASASISDGDLVDRRIHGPQQQWALMPVHALTSCVLPAYEAAGQARGRFNFTAYLGQNSKATKYRRLLAEVRAHMRLALDTTARDLRLELQPLLAFRLLAPLLARGADAVPDIISFMDAHYLTREDWDTIMELGVGPRNSGDMAKDLPTATKTAFTRKYNAATHPLPFMNAATSKAAAAAGRRTETPDLDDVIADDTAEPEVKDEVEDTLDEAMKNDKYIKAKPKPRAAKKAPAKKAPAKRAPRAKK